MDDGEEGDGSGPSQMRVLLPIIVPNDLEKGAPNLLVVRFSVRGDQARRERSQFPPKDDNLGVLMSIVCSVYVGGWTGVGACPAMGDRKPGRIRRRPGLGI